MRWVRLNPERSHRHDAVYPWSNSPKPPFALIDGEMENCETCNSDIIDQRVSRWERELLYASNKVSSLPSTLRYNHKFIRHDVYRLYEYRQARWPHTAWQANLHQLYSRVIASPWNCVLWNDFTLLLNHTDAAFIVMWCFGCGCGIAKNLPRYSINVRFKLWHSNAALRWWIAPIKRVKSITA